MYLQRVSIVSLKNSICKVLYFGHEKLSKNYQLCAEDAIFNAAECFEVALQQLKPVLYKHHRLLISRSDIFKRKDIHIWLKNNLID